MFLNLKYPTSKSMTFQGQAAPLGLQELQDPPSEFMLDTPDTVIEAAILRHCKHSKEQLEECIG